MSTLKSATTVTEASDAILTGYEKPVNQSDSAKTKRAGYGQIYYNKYARNTDTTESGDSKSTVTEQKATRGAQSFDKSIADTYKTTANLNMRNGASKSYSVMVG